MSSIAKAPAKDLDLNIALDVIQEYIANTANDPIPEGYYTTKQLMDKWGKGYTRTKQLCCIAVEMGMADVITIKRGQSKPKVYRFKGGYDQSRPRKNKK